MSKVADGFVDDPNIRMPPIEKKVSPLTHSTDDLSPDEPKPRKLASLSDAMRHEYEHHREHYFPGPASDDMSNKNTCTASAMTKYYSQKEIIILARGYKDGSLTIDTLLSPDIHLKLPAHQAEVTSILAIPIQV